MHMTPTEIKEKATKKELEIKAHLFDEMLDLIEDRYLGETMQKREKEKTVSVQKALKTLDSHKS